MNQAFENCLREYRIDSTHTPSNDHRMRGKGKL